MRNPITRTLTALGASLALTAGALAAVPAQAAPAKAAAGNTSLAEVLGADGVRFDRNWDDFDVVERAVLRVLDRKPSSAVSVLTDGDVALTAFVPTDRAFRRLVFDLTGQRPATERATWRVVRSLGVPTIETVLLYHVVPGATVTYRQALGADGAKLTTAQGGKIRVVVRGHVVRLADRDFNDLNPRVIRALKNINKGNPQIAHGISLVLRPVDL